MEEGRRIRKNIEFGNVVKDMRKRKAKGWEEDLRKRNRIWRGGEEFENEKLIFGTGLRDLRRRRSEFKYVRLGYGRSNWWLKRYIL